MAADLWAESRLRWSSLPAESGRLQGRAGLQPEPAAPHQSRPARDPPSADNGSLQTRTFSIRASNCGPVTMETVDNPGELAKDLVETGKL